MFEMLTLKLTLKAFQRVVIGSCARPHAERKFWLLRRPRITLVTLSGRHDSIFCVTIINEVAFFRGINFLSGGINRNTSKYMGKKLQRAEVSRKQNFDQIIVINHPPLRNYDRAFLIVAYKS